MIKKITLFFLIAVNFLLAQDSILFCIRVDDILSRSITTLPRSIKQFQYAVEQRGSKVTWAVIPHRLIETQNEDGVLAQELRETIQAGHEIVLHGYNHICPICGSSNHEMYCSTQSVHLSYSQQLGLITDGLKILLDTLHVVPKLFVPPGHSQDTVTFQVLVDKNFEFLSSVGGTKKFIYQDLYNLQQNVY